jgi:hypothetical protein
MMIDRRVPRNTNQRQSPELTGKTGSLPRAADALPESRLEIVADCSGFDEAYEASGEVLFLRRACGHGLLVSPAIGPFRQAMAAAMRWSASLSGMGPTSALPRGPPPGVRPRLAASVNSRQRECR